MLMPQSVLISGTRPSGGLKSIHAIEGHHQDAGEGPKDQGNRAVE
jgi:hypothetical protein